MGNQTTARNKAHSKPQKGPCVLLADDDLPILRALKARVEHAGFEVQTASDGISAVMWANELHPDVAVLDINMPGLDGFGIAEKITSSTPDCKIIFLTANRSAALRTQAAEFDATFLEKPFKSQQLTDEIIRAGRLDAA